MRSPRKRPSAYDSDPNVPAFARDLALRVDMRLGRARSVHLKAGSPGTTGRNGRPAGVFVLGEMLRRHREERCMTQTELSDLASVSVKTVQRIESGGPASAAAVREVCRLLGVAPHRVIRPSPDDVIDRLSAAGRSPQPAHSQWLVRSQADAILAALSAPGARCIVSGRSGIGKSVMARQVVDRIRAQFDMVCVWIDGDAIANPARRQRTFDDIAYALGFSALLPDPSATSPEAFGRAFRYQLSQHEVLLVVDGLEAVGHLEPVLADDSGSRCLVTTRYRHVATAWAAAVVELGPLDDGESRALLGRFVDPRRFEADPVGTETILRMCCGSPRCLEIAGRLLEREQMTTPSHVYERVLRDAAQRQAMGLAGAERFESEHLALLDAARADLSERAWTVLGCLSAFGDAPFTSRWVATAAALSEADALAALGELIDHHLLHLNSAGAARRMSLDRYERHLALLAGQFGDPGAAAQRVARRIADEAQLVLEAGAATSGPWMVELRETIWRVFDGLLAGIGPRTRVDQVDLPSQLPAVALPLASARALIDFLLAFDIGLANYPTPGYDAWLGVAIAAARGHGLRREYGALLRIAAWYRSLGRLGWQSSHAWFDEARDVLAAAGDPYLAGATESIRGTVYLVTTTPGRCLDSQLVALDLVRASQVRGARLGALLSRIAYGIMSAGTTPPPWEFARALLREAVEESAGGPPWVAALVRANLAYYEHVFEGHVVPSAELTRALADLLAASTGCDASSGLVRAHAASFGLALGEPDLAAAWRRARSEWRRGTGADGGDAWQDARVLGTAAVFMLFHWLALGPDGRHTMTAHGATALTPPAPNVAASVNGCGFNALFLVSLRALEQLLDASFLQGLADEPGYGDGVAFREIYGRLTAMRAG